VRATPSGVGPAVEMAGIAATGVTATGSVGEGDPLEEAGAEALALVAGVGNGAAVADSVGVATGEAVAVGEAVALAVAVGGGQAGSDVAMGVPAGGRAVSPRSAEMASPAGRAQPPARIAINNQLPMHQTFLVHRALPALILVCPTPHSCFADRAGSIAASPASVKACRPAG
jgi:hypothetical protein